MVVTAEDTASRAGSRANESVSGVVDQIKRMIVSSDLLPGQQIRQDRLAKSLGTSRQPIREALHQLVAEGLVSHSHNVGYSVARLSVTEFDQIYALVKLIETEIIRSLKKPTPQQVNHLKDLHERIAAAGEAQELASMRLLNYEFHFAIFNLSELGLFLNTLQRAWTWALPYHSVYLYNVEGRRRVVAEHAKMIEAIQQGDTERLVDLMNEHRAGSGQQVNLVLGK
jgi:DNA-binding GntR family transcriptional regulator